MAFTGFVCSIINEKGRVKKLSFFHTPFLFRNKVAMISYILPHNPAGLQALLSTSESARSG